jgi:glycosyltransferase involved in cell wall biosynthesis
MTRKIRLLFVIDNCCYGGGEKTFSLLIRSLPAERFELFCASLPQGRFYEEIKDHCRFLPLDLSNRFDLRNVGRLRALLTEHGIDIAHSQGARADFYCALAAAGAGVKSVATVAMPVEGFDVGPVRKALYSVLSSCAARRNAAAITITGELAERIKGRYRAVELIPNPVDLAEYSPSNFNAAPVIEKFGLRGKLVLCALGRLENQKGFTYLLSALKAAFEKEPELREKLRCLIAGAGSLAAKLKKQAEREGVAGSVVFCGEVANARDFLGAADIFVMPSLREGQPLALLEAMAMEKPVLASDIPGISGTAEAGREALLVPPADPAALAEGLLKLVHDMPAALAMGRAARKKAERFGLPEFVSAHEAFYGRLAGGN